MKAIKFPLILLGLIALGAVSYFYKNHQETKRREAMIKEDRENRRVLSEAHEKTSDAMARDIRDY